MWNIFAFTKETLTFTENAICAVKLWLQANEYQTSEFNLLDVKNYSLIYY